MKLPELKKFLNAATITVILTMLIPICQTSISMQFMTNNGTQQTLMQTKVKSSDFQQTLNLLKRTDLKTNDDLKALTKEIKILGCNITDNNNHIKKMQKAVIAKRKSGEIITVEINNTTSVPTTLPSEEKELKAVRQVTDNLFKNADVIVTESKDIIELAWINAPCDDLDLSQLSKEVLQRDILRIYDYTDQDYKEGNSTEYEYEM